MTDDPKTMKRVQVILAHLSGRINATEAARELGVSRKTFYQWLDRAREGMFQALMDRPGGRPPEPVDEEKESLRSEVEALTKDRALLEGRLRIQEVFRGVLSRFKQEPKKKPQVRADGRSRPGCNEETRGAL